MQKPLAGLTRQNVVRESVAGVTLLAIAIPLNIGYAQIAGLPATAGLYALVVPTVIYALVVVAPASSSRHRMPRPPPSSPPRSAGSRWRAPPTTPRSRSPRRSCRASCSCCWRSSSSASSRTSSRSRSWSASSAAWRSTSWSARSPRCSASPIDSGGEFVDKVVELVIGGCAPSNLISLLISVVSVAVLLVGKRFLRAVPWALVVLVARTILVMVAGLDEPGSTCSARCPAGPPALTWPILEWTTWLAADPVGDGAHPRHHRRRAAGRAVVRREARLPDSAQPRPASPSGSATSPPERAAASRWDPRRRAPRRWIRPDRAPSCPRSCSRRAPSCSSCSAPPCSPTSRPRDRRDRRPWRSCPCSASASSSALWHLDRFEFAHRGGLLPRHAVHRLDPRHPRRVRPRPDQPRQACREPGDRRARHERCADRLAPRRRPRRIGDRARHRRHPARRAALLRQRRCLRARGQARSHARRATLRCTTSSSTWRPSPTST